MTGTVEFIQRIRYVEIPDEKGEMQVYAIPETVENIRELVRCKDCKHGSLYCTEDVCGETLIECNRPDLGDVIEIHGWKWFCADGVKRDE